MTHVFEALSFFDTADPVAINGSHCLVFRHPLSVSKAATMVKMSL